MQMFVTWIVPQMTALHLGFGLSWTERVWIRVCIIIQKHNPSCCPNVCLASAAERPRCTLLQSGYGYIPQPQKYMPYLSADSKQFINCFCFSVQVAFGGGGASLWWCGGVSIVGDLRDAVTGVVQYLLLGTRTNILSLFQWCHAY